MDPGPANEFYFVAVQVEILGQYGLNVALVGFAVHGLAQLDYSAKFVAAAILRVSQNELRVVLGRHGFRLRERRAIDCELEHKTREMLQCSNPVEIRIFATASDRGIKLSKFGRGAQI